MSPLINPVDVLFLVALVVGVATYEIRIRPYLDAIKWAKGKYKGLSFVE